MKAQEQILASLGAQGDDLAALERYNENHFDLAVLDEQPLPHDDEPCVEQWATWLRRAGGGAVWPLLRADLPQLAFPVAAGMSATDDYRAATLAGRPVNSLEKATGLEIEQPEGIELMLHRTAAGRIPVLIVRQRQDFVALVQALGRRNEARPVPAAMGALMVAGFNNWARIRERQAKWRETPPEDRETATWKEEFSRLRAHKELFQDRFMILSNGPYSAVPAGDLGLQDDDWRERSLVIRREHEATHYFTRRLFGSMRNNLLDELIADYTGIVAAEGYFRADWFRRFVGLQADGAIRSNGRINIYRGDPPLSDAAFAVLGKLVVRAAEHLEAFDRVAFSGPPSLRQQAVMIVALATLRLENLAASDGADAIGRARDEAERRLRWRKHVAD
ncbi:MAG: hypothetical protein AAF604_16560 [Acidobacteriota bacterium]